MVDTPSLLTMPFNPEAEQAFLGGIFIDNEVYHRCSGFLRDIHFGDVVHQEIYRSIASLMNKHRVVTPVTILPFVEYHPSFQGEITAAQYLSALTGVGVGAAVAVDYARMIFDLAQLRSLSQVSSNIQSRLHTTVPAVEQISLAEQELYSLSQSGQAERGVVSFTEAIEKSIRLTEAAHKRGGGLAGVPCFLTDLDEKLGGLHPSDLIILAGRPSMGKTALSTNIAFNVAVNKKGGNPMGKGVAFFSLEMSAEQLAGRILSEQSELSSEKLRRGQLTPQEFETLLGAAQDITETPLFIDDTPAIPISTLATRSRKLKRQHDIGLIVVDYLQLVRPASGSGRSENRVQELSEITQGLKALAKELNVPVVALSQLSRAVENREDKRPQLSDLRESGSIEQDADVVMFVFREEYYLMRSEPAETDTLNRSVWQEKMTRAKGTAEVIIGKQRHGPIGTVRLSFIPEFTRFGDLAQTNDVR